MLLIGAALLVAAASALRTVRLPAYLNDREEASIDPADYPASYINIPVDHYNDSDSRMYNNRYWVNSKYYQPGGPVFYFDAGEQNASPLVPYFLYEVAGPSSVMALARRFNGITVLFEHRFYGDLDNGSFPFAMDETGMPRTGYTAYRYLNTEQALQDPVYFAEHFQPPGLKQHWDSMKPWNSPWVWLGGSYPGIRGAMMRIRNPETFFATWASSAPTQAAIDMWTYYAQAERSMTRNCSADYTAVTKWVDSILANGTVEETDRLKIDLYGAVLSGPGGTRPMKFNEREAKQLSNVEVANFLLLPLSFYQYYGFEASVQPFCDIVETRNRTCARTTDNGGTAPALSYESGLAAVDGVKAAWDAFLVGIAEIDYDSIPYTNDPVQAYSWAWQYCSEYGYYQRGNPENPHTIQSSFISLELYQENCNAIFSEGLPPHPNVSAPNKYGGWRINPSNTMFSSGEYDPWRALSPGSIEVDSPHRTTSQSIPRCNVAPPNDTIFGIIYRDMVHVSDMRALLNASDVNHQNFSTVGFSSPISTEPFYAGLGLFQSALEVWLPCFKNNSYADMTFQFSNSKSNIDDSY